MSKKRIVFIVNPKSGTQRVKAIEEAIEQYLDHEQFNYEVKFTEYKAHGIEIAAELVKEHVDLIVSVGGDGSLHDIVQSVVHTSVPIAVWPLGSGNGLARSLDISFKPYDILNVINQFNWIEIDTGEVDGHYFIATCGLGFDAEISDLFQNSVKRGFWSYTWLIIKSLPRYQPLKIKATHQSKMIYEGKAFILNAANVPQLGYGFEIAPLADWQDAQFDLMIVKPIPFFMLPFVAIRAFTKRLHKSRYVKRVMVDQLTVSAPYIDGFQMDGEFVSTSESQQKQILIKIRPKSLRILVGSK